MDIINKKLHLDNNKNIIFVYCPPKVGSTSLVSSLRLFALNQYVVVHLHNETMLRALYDIKDVTINEIIQYNSLLGKKIFVIDIYRSPIEQKISMFFEELVSLHFNSNTNVKMETIIQRFNNIFPYISTPDFFKNVYPKFPETNVGHWIIKENDTENNIKYIKLRLKDSETDWATILKEQLQIPDLQIVKDYETENKSIKDKFIQFKQEYKIPANLLALIKEDVSLLFYYTEEERNEYISFWENKVADEYKYYTEDEYKLYKTISYENQIVELIYENHYIDMGCSCKGCTIKRNNIISRIKKGEKISNKIIHEPSAPILIPFKKRIYIKKKAPTLKTIGRIF